MRLATPPPSPSHADVYAYGMTLYEVIARRHPFQARSRRPAPLCAVW